MARPRKPTSLKILDGDRKDRINGDEPKSDPGLGKPPDWFDDLARYAWGRLKSRLDEMGVSTRADDEAAVVYCVSYSTLRRAETEVEKYGMLVEQTTSSSTRNVTTIRTILKANPMLPAIAQARRQMMQCLTQMGMTPSSRAGLHVAEKAEDDLFLAFMQRGKTAPPDGNQSPKKAAKAKG